MGLHGALPGSNNEGRAASSLPHENWMWESRDWLTNVELSNVTLPGTHDSGTYSVGTRLSPDGVDFYRSAAGMGVYSMGRVVHDWAVAQDPRFDLLAQLRDGVRYLDLRLALDPEEAGKAKLEGRSLAEAVFIVHSVWGTGAVDVIEQIATFVSSHPHEIVLLDFQHFYGMTREAHEDLLKLISSKLGEALIPADTPKGINTTIGELWDNSTSVLMWYNVAREQLPESAPVGVLWDREATLTSYWPNTHKPELVKASIDSWVADHVPGQTLFLAQAVLTPDISMYIRALAQPPSTLGQLAAVLNPLIEGWLEDKNPDTGWFHAPFNIVMVDWITTTGIVPTIIDINKTRWNRTT